jgi:translation initiation factor 3 subunit L
MADSDACVPQVVTDFIFDLSDSLTLAQIPEEQSQLYNVAFRELCSKYFSTSPWPSPKSIAAECNGDPLVLAFYREVTHRHFHSISRPTVGARIEGWNVYKELFDEILLDAEEKSQQSPAAFFVLPEWCFDILHEFVYQFQGYCQFRQTVAASAAKHGIPPGASPTKNAPHHLIENMTILSQNKDAWAVDQVFYYLHRLVTIGKTAKAPGYQYLGIFASTVLSRLECLLGDYKGCLLALDMDMDAVIDNGEVVQTVQEVVHSVLAARVSWAYHAGVAYLMLRRYKDGTRILGDICSYMQRGFKTGQIRKLPNSDQYAKLLDRMIGILAILTHISPPTGLVDDSILKVIREKQGGTLAKIDAGEAGYEDLFMYACPKFVSPSAQVDAYKLQVQQFVQEMSSQGSSRKMRSYMKLYTSISVEKLAAFNDMTKEEFLPLLLSYKHKMNQLEEDGKMGSALDIHYYLVNDMCHVDEAERERRFENYFMTQIEQNGEILMDVNEISTTV